MLHRACIALLLLLSACATMEPSPTVPLAQDARIANLQRAAQYPWTDDGHCVVQEASNEWSSLVEKCYHALDRDRVKFRDVTGRCAVASAGAAAVGMGLCVFAAPEIVVGAVIVVGVVAVAVAIKEELDAHERNASRERGKPKTQAQPSNEQESVANRKAKREGSPLGRDWFPPDPPVSSDPHDRRPECMPKRASHRGGNDPHNECADPIPQNSFPGWDVLVNGKHFDALQLATRTLWEVKTDNFDTYPPDLRAIVVESQVEKLRHERALALACGFDFRVGVRSLAHKAALELAAPDLDGIIEVMKWC
ncbi:DUF6310 domain-containing protein [Hyalangium rubrum]|uniref:DUF6310 domain-containing protein n=1 Tax=Hyalangium rubrum TaxID=3103134 RepID=A0ABU5GWN0_9BACT|nr:DUF6310 domain-containing protein [Hyalangium sp. s54d21]MDY7224908.1 DUF6310 domain-containing protein [Hyalangium sp. s54d21]